MVIIPIRGFQSVCRLSFAKASLRIIGIRNSPVSFAVFDGNQSGTAIILIRQRKFGILPCFYGKSGFVPITVIGIILYDILIFCQFGRFFCDLAGYIAIHKLCIILYCHISIGVVTVSMYGFFSGLFLLCCPLSQPVFIIICVFQLRIKHTNFINLVIIKIFLLILHPVPQKNNMFVIFCRMRGHFCKIVSTLRK